MFKKKKDIICFDHTWFFSGWAIALKVERFLLRVMFVGFLRASSLRYEWFLRNRSGMHSYLYNVYVSVYIYICMCTSILSLHSTRLVPLLFRKCYFSIAPQYSRYPSSYIQLDLRHMWVKHLKSSALESCSLNKDFWSSVGEIPTSITEKKTLLDYEHVQPPQCHIT